MIDRQREKAAVLNTCVRVISSYCIRWRTSIKGMDETPSPSSGHVLAGGSKSNHLWVLSVLNRRSSAKSSESSRLGQSSSLLRSGQTNRRQIPNSANSNVHGPVA